MYGYIYKIKNTVNNKVYIGQTTKAIKIRFAQHCQKAKNLTQPNYTYIHLYAAMKKYGIDKFVIEEIDTAQTALELNHKEEYWIQLYNSIETGYNMMPGGTDKNPMDSKRVKEKHDSIMQLEETRKKISVAMHKYRAENGFSEEHKQKIKTAREKRKRVRAENGLNFYEHPEHMASRSMSCYCILASGERYEFKSILDAGKWWYKTDKPFGEIYSSATYRRKIEASTRGEEISYGCKTHKKHKIITGISWFWVV